MKKMFLILLAGSLVLFAGCKGADGLLETNVVTGSFKVPAMLYSYSQSYFWVVTLDDDLDSSNGVIAMDSGVIIANQETVTFDLINIPAGNYYLFAHTDIVDVGADAVFDGIVNQIGPDKESISAGSLAGANEACAFYGRFTDTQAVLLNWESVEKIHPAAENVTVPQSGWVDLDPFSLLLIPGV